LNGGHGSGRCDAALRGHNPVGPKVEFSLRFFIQSNVSFVRYPIHCQTPNTSQHERLSILLSLGVVVPFVCVGLGFRLRIGCSTTDSLWPALIPLAHLPRKILSIHPRKSRFFVVQTIIAHPISHADQQKKKQRPHDIVSAGESAGAGSGSQTHGQISSAEKQHGRKLN